VNPENEAALLVVPMALDVLVLGVSVLACLAWRGTRWIETLNQASVWLLYQSKPYCAVPWEIARDTCSTRQLTEKICVSYCS
jgi:hypothetical protein